MSRLFNTISIPFKKRNKFDLSYETRLTTEFGRLTPFLCEPVLPNDRFQLSSTIRVQFAPMTFPVMQKFSAYMHYFFVPNRLLWDNWEEFITGGEDGLQEPDYPVINMNQAFSLHLNSLHMVDSNTNLVGTSSLWDYLGYPVLDISKYSQFYEDASQNGHTFDILPFKAYQAIYNEWYRDQNVSEEIDLLTNQSGSQLLADYDDTSELLKLRQRAWKKDYFTSALPDPQRGPDVTLPLVGDMPIEFTSQGAVLPGTKIVDPAGGSLEFLQGSELQVGDAATTDPEGPRYLSVYDDGTNSPVEIDNSANLMAVTRDENDDPAIRSATINEVRRAFAVQRWFELAARAGSRYVEQILAHFGIRSSDARLQRPEYLGGSVVPVYVGDVLQTSETTNDGTPLGTPAGVAQAMGGVKPIRRTFEEHGWILGILSVIPQASYFQGIPKKYLKRDKFDFAWPLLANLGEQEIQKQELYFDVKESKEINQAGFGYAPRYSEYKFGMGQVHGDFQGNLLDFHDARVFSDQPVLNSSFIEVQAGSGSSSLNRVFSVTSGLTDHLWVYMYNDVKVRRVLPKYGTPI